jgi:hypothetical protein
MDEQKKFQEADLVDGEVINIKFRNILDRGYRGNDAAQLMDQLCLQPPSAIIFDMTSDDHVEAWIKSQKKTAQTNLI